MFTDKSALSKLIFWLVLFSISSTVFAFQQPETK
ncbi:MAG: hypothetical protein FD167_3554, partial [bacterium]